MSERSIKQTPLKKRTQFMAKSWMCLQFFSKLEKCKGKVMGVLECGIERILMVQLSNPLKAALLLQILGFFYLVI